MCLFHNYGKWVEKVKEGHLITMMKKCKKCDYAKYKFITEPCSFSNYNHTHTSKRSYQGSGNVVSTKSISQGNCLVCNREDFNSVYIS